MAAFLETNKEDPKVKAMSTSDIKRMFGLD